jgi:hypothetical protein
MRIPIDLLEKKLDFGNVPIQGGLFSKWPGTCCHGSGYRK